MKGPGSGGTSREQQRRLRALAELADRIREDRAAGRKRWRGAAAALRWYALTRESWASAKALTMRDEGSGTPSRGAENPARRRFAAVAMGIRRATEDDQARHPTARAPIETWVLEHFGAGRAYAWIAESSERWTEAEVEARVRRAARVVALHLREGGWLEGREED